MTNIRLHKTYFSLQEGITIRCGQMLQYSWNHREAICGPRPPDFLWPKTTTFKNSQHRDNLVNLCNWHLNLRNTLADQFMLQKGTFVGGGQYSLLQAEAIILYKFQRVYLVLKANTVVIIGHNTINQFWMVILITTSILK